MYTPVFQDIPNDWQGRLRVLRRFIESLYTTRMPDVGRVPKAATKLASTLKVQHLPPSVLEWIAFTEDLPKATKNAVLDLHPYRLKITDFPAHRSISLAGSPKGMQWGVAYDRFNEDDPPVSSYAYVEAKKGFVQRKSYGTAPVSEFAIHFILNHAMANYAAMGSPLKNPKKLIQRLPKKLAISRPLGSLRFVEGRGWFAVIQDGWGPYGREKKLTLRFRRRIAVQEIPPRIREMVGMKG